MEPGQYMLASAASQVVMLPTGQLALMGLYGEGLYFKNLLDKFGCQADIIHCGDYKSAGEPFYLTGPSKAAQEQENRIFDSIYEQMIACIAESRKLSESDVKGLIDRGILHASEAKEAKLIDHVMYREDFKKALHKRYGDDVQIVFDYGEEKAPEINFDNPMAIFEVMQKLFGQDEEEEEADDSAIGIVYVDSMITSGRSQQGFFGSNSGSDTVRRAIEKAAEDDSIKAVVLRVDSPGGSAIASEVICEAIERCKEKKPVVASMGNVAASGGYYVSCLADAIVADPATITGSIGVVGGKFVTKGLWDWIGVTSHEYKRGARADIMNSNRPFAAEERDFISGVMDRVYDEFKSRVTAGRGKKLKGDLDKLAGGRVYTGTQALEIGLVDDLGGFMDAVRLAAEKADISSYELRIFPKPKTFMDMLMEAVTGGGDKDEVEAKLGAAWLALPAIQQALPMIEQLDPRKATAVKRALMQVDLLNRDGVMTLDASIPLMR